VVRFTLRLSYSQEEPSDSKCGGFRAGLGVLPSTSSGVGLWLLR